MISTIVHHRETTAVTLVESAAIDAYASYTRKYSDNNYYTVLASFPCYISPLNPVYQHPFAGQTLASTPVLSTLWWNSQTGNLPARDPFSPSQLGRTTKGLLLFVKGKASTLQSPTLEY